MTDNLVTLRLSALTKVEFGQFLTRFLKDFDDSQLSLDDEISLTLLSRLRSLLASYNQAQEKVVLTESSSKIQEADDARDHDLSALLASIRLFANSREADEQTAYQALSKVFDDYRKTASANYEAESAQINHLLQQAKDKTLQPYLKLLGADRFVRRLENSQAAFETLYHNRAKSKAGTPTANHRELRTELHQIYLDLSDYILIMARYSRNTSYKETLAVLNRSRKSYADTLAKRKGNQKKTNDNKEEA